VSCTRPRLTTLSLSEGTRKENGELDKHLRLILLDDIESTIGSSLVDRHSLRIRQVSKTRVVEEDRYSLRIGNPR